MSAFIAGVIIFVVFMVLIAVWDTVSAVVTYGRYSSSPDKHSEPDEPDQE